MSNRQNQTCEVGTDAIYFMESDYNVVREVKRRFEKKKEDMK